MFKDKKDRHFREIAALEQLQLSVDLNNEESDSRNRLFYPHIQDCSAEENHSPSGIRHDDPVHVYSDLNSFAYRSPEFGPVELVTLGCSQTFGLGVCRENIWPEVLAKKLKMSHVNLAYPGWSLNRAIQAFYSHVAEYGPPKAVALLAPDLGRLTYPIRGEYTAYTKLDRRAEKTALTVGEINIHPDEGQWLAEEVPNISKRPHLLSDVLTPEVAVLQSFQALNNLLIFCMATGIAVSIDTWNPNTANLLKDLDYIDESVLALLTTRREMYNEMYQLEECDHHSADGYAHDEFYQATDHGRHMGAHQHLHHAELAYEIIKNQLDK